MNGGIEPARLDWEADAPRSIFFDDIYFSGDGAAETKHVFIDGNDLERRFAGASRFTIGELGFGTGLNFLVAADVWRRTAPAGASLNFLSFEKHPLGSDDLARAHRAWPRYAALSRALFDAWPATFAGVRRLDFGDGLALTLVLGDAREMLPRIDARVDAWFLDGFAPSKNPELWSPDIFAEVARLSAPGASAATFTVAGDVRRALRAAGFSVEKQAGFGRKREMLRARLETPPPAPARAPWFDMENTSPLAPGARIAIIGGGVAGASLARAVGVAGLAPTIIDAKGLAAGASGNPAGLLMPRLDLGEGAAARFFRAAYLHALSTIDGIGGATFFNRCGVLLKATNDEARNRQRKLFAEGLLPDGWIEAQADGLFFPQAGVIDPPRYVAALAAQTPLIIADATAIDADEDKVSIRLSTQQSVRFDAVVIANGCEALRFVEARSLPLAGVMGQVDHFPQAPAPASAITFGPYAAPAPGGGLVIGATFDKCAIGAAPSVSAVATRANIDAVAAALSAVSALDPAGARPRAAIRCQTPDRLPVAGPMPDWHYYGATYDDLRFGRNSAYPRARALPRVFILAGLGARGLVTAPLLAATIAAAMTGAPAPLERDIAEAIHPARFFIRALKHSR